MFKVIRMQNKLGEHSNKSKNEKEDDIITEEDIPKFIEKKIKSA